MQYKGLFLGLAFDCYREFSIEKVVVVLPDKVMDNDPEVVMQRLLAISASEVAERQRKLRILAPFMQWGWQGQDWDGDGWAMSLLPFHKIHWIPKLDVPLCDKPGPWQGRSPIPFMKTLNSRSTDTSNGHIKKSWIGRRNPFKAFLQPLRQSRKIRLFVPPEMLHALATAKADFRLVNGSAVRPNQVYPGNPLRANGTTRQVQDWLRVHTEYIAHVSACMSAREVLGSLDSKVAVAVSLCEYIPPYALSLMRYMHAFPHVCICL